MQQVRTVLKKINTENLKKLSKSRRFWRWIKRIVIFIIVVHLIGIVINFVKFKVEFWDSDKDRGAIALDNDLFDESFSTPVYLDQGWSKSDSLWFYNTSQGSDLIPYDFYMALEQVESTQLFSANEHILKYRFLIQKKTFSNPDALPIGFVKDEYMGEEYLGFTCAACHTSQINYVDKHSQEKKAIRIDGGPAQSDLSRLVLDLSDALQETLADEAKKQRFIKRVLDRNGLKKLLTGGKNYSNEEEVSADLHKMARKLMTYNWINRSDTPYGYSRLDAFGRIYNRIVEHIIDKRTLKKVLANFLNETEARQVFDQVDNLTDDNLQLVDTTLDILSYEQKEQFFTSLFTSADAPVSYPYLWDIPYHDHLQWNGIVNNSGPGSLGRNVGQVIGVFGTLDWKKDDSFNLSRILRNETSVLESVSFHTSIDVRNLARVEDQIKQLTSPLWPEDKLGAIDRSKADKGRAHFKKYCIECHGDIDRTNPKRRITAHLSSIKNIGTDAKMAENSVNKTGYTGLIQGSYVDIPMGKVLLQEKAPVALMVMATTENVLKTPNMDSNIFVRWSDWVYDLFFVYFNNPVEDTIKKGDYTPDSSAAPFASLLSYKARPLNGIWATAPYLHNGSVPTLYDLLLPKSERPETFMVGSRVFDSDKVGFMSEGYDGFELDTNQTGNSNSGHEYAAGKTAMPNGKPLDALTKDQRSELLEYLKTL